MSEGGKKGLRKGWRDEGETSVAIDREQKEKDEEEGGREAEAAEDGL